GSSPASGASSSPPKQNALGAWSSQRSSLVQQALRLVDPVLRLLLVQRLLVESSGVEGRLDLARQRVALVRQILDRRLDLVVDALVRASDRPRGRGECVHCELAERCVDLLVDRREPANRLTVSDQRL